MTQDTKLGLTAEDLSKMRSLADAKLAPDTLTADPADSPPTWDNERNKKIGPQMSRKIVEYSEKHTIREAADHFGLSTRTVKRHRATWNEESGDSDQLLFDGGRIVDDRLCGVMREMALDGIPQQGIADRFGLGMRTVRSHVVAGESCRHDIPIPRTRFGNPVTSGECDRMRRMMRERDLSASVVADRTGRSYNTVNRHTSSNRECSCDNMESPVVY